MKYLSGSGLGYFYSKIKTQLNNVYKKSETYSRTEIDNKLSGDTNGKWTKLWSIPNLTSSASLSFADQNITLSDDANNYDAFVIVYQIQSGAGRAYCSSEMIFNLKKIYASVSTLSYIAYGSIMYLHHNGTQPWYRLITFKNPNTVNISSCYLTNSQDLKEFNNNLIPLDIYGIKLY